MGGVTADAVTVVFGLTSSALELTVSQWQLSYCHQKLLKYVNRQFQMFSRKPKDIQKYLGISNAQCLLWCHPIKIQEKTIWSSQARLSLRHLNSSLGFSPS